VQGCGCRRQDPGEIRRERSCPSWTNWTPGGQHASQTLAQVPFAPGHNLRHQPAPFFRRCFSTERSRSTTAGLKDDQKLRRGAPNFLFTGSVRGGERLAVPTPWSTTASSSASIQALPAGHHRQAGAWPRPVAHVRAHPARWRQQSDSSARTYPSTGVLRPREIRAFRDVAAWLASTPVFITPGPCKHPPCKGFTHKPHDRCPVRNRKLALRTAKDGLQSRHRCGLRPAPGRTCAATRSSSILGDAFAALDACPADSVDRSSAWTSWSTSTPARRGVCSAGPQQADPRWFLLCRTPSSDGPFGSHDRHNDLTHRWAMTANSAFTFMRIAGSRLQVSRSVRKPRSLTKSRISSVGLSSAHQRFF